MLKVKDKLYLLWRDFRPDRPGVANHLVILELQNFQLKS